MHRTQDPTSWSMPAQAAPSAYYHPPVPPYPPAGQQAVSYSAHGVGTAPSSHLTNTSQGWTMSKWPLRFGGRPKDLPVEEFIFRTETLARLSGLPQTALALGLHQLLTDSASSWYWIFIRNHPNATWIQTREAITRAFQSNVSDAAIRRLIMDRVQRPGERFMEFNLAIQELEVRLTIPMTEQELMETLRRNMLPHIQDRLLFVPIQSIDDLQGRVQQVEELAQQQLEVQQFRRLPPRVHEISAPPPIIEDRPVASSYNRAFLAPPPPLARPDIRSNPFAQQMANIDPDCPPNEQTDFVCAMGAVQDRNQYTVCWNCDELGHTFMDCAAQRIIFCYGCGTKNVIRPQCPKCSLRAIQGNGHGSGRQNGNMQNPPQLHHPNQQRRLP